MINNTRRATARRRRPYLVLFLLLGALVSTRYASDAEDASANSAWSDDAHPPIDITTLDNIPVEIWGVSGQNPSQTQTPSLEVLVWDIQQVGDRIFNQVETVDVRFSASSNSLDALRESLGHFLGGK